MLSVPLMLTPLNMTATRFTHDGMLVKSIAVPLVVASAVPSVGPAETVAVPLLIETDAPFPAATFEITPAAR